MEQLYKCSSSDAIATFIANLATFIHPASPEYTEIMRELRNAQQEAITSEYLTTEDFRRKLDDLLNTNLIPYNNIMDSPNTSRVSQTNISD